MIIDKGSMAVTGSIELKNDLSNGDGNTDVSVEDLTTLSDEHLEALMIVCCRELRFRYELRHSTEGDMQSSDHRRPLLEWWLGLLELTFGRGPLNRNAVFYSYSGTLGDNGRSWWRATGRSSLDAE